MIAFIAIGFGVIASFFGGVFIGKKLFTKKPETLPVLTDEEIKERNAKKEYFDLVKRYKFLQSKDIPSILNSPVTSDYFSYNYKKINKDVKTILDVLISSSPVISVEFGYSNYTMYVEFENNIFVEFWISNLWYGFGLRGKIYVAKDKKKNRYWDGELLASWHDEITGYNSINFFANLFIENTENEEAKNELEKKKNVSKALDIILGDKIKTIENVV